MDEALVVRDDLRSYALRRCIRFYTALVLTSIGWVGSRLASGPARGEVLLGTAALLLVLVAVEVAAFAVSRPMAAARARLGGGPETRLWAFAQGPGPSLVAAAFFLVLAASLAWVAR